MEPEVRRAVARFKLGYVVDPIPGHQMYEGMLAIPYLRRGPSGKWLVVTMRFRCLKHECLRDDNGDYHFPNGKENHASNGKKHGKYMSLPGGENRLFNTFALISNHDQVGIAEGELDAIAATAHGIPTVGVPGADTWESHFFKPFLGYEAVYGLADADDNGQGIKFMRKVAKQLPNFKVTPMPDGMDVNSMTFQNGGAAFRERIGIDV